MSVKLLEGVNGVGVTGDIVTLNPALEAALVSSRKATYQVAPFEFDEPVTARRTLTGGIGFVMPDGSKLPAHSNTKFGSGLEIMPVGDVSMWNTDKTAGLILAVDPTVLFDGRPTLKITIPAGTSGTCKVGCATAAANIPYNWDRNDFATAVMYSGFTGYDMSSTFPPVLSAYIGDAAFSNFWAAGGYSGSNYPEQKMRQGEWCVEKKTSASGWTPSGSPAVAANMRCKLQWTQVSQGTDSYIWIGFFGRMAPRKKPTIIWTLDDGYPAWYSFIYPLFKHYDMPVSLGIDSAFVDQPSWLTKQQILTMFNDSSRLFDIVNHGVNNQNYNTLGASAYYQTLETTRKYLQGIGIYGDGPLHHPYVQSVWGNDLIDLMKSGGYLSARAAANGVISHGKDSLLVDDKDRWLTNISSALTNTKTLAAAKTDVDWCVTNNTFGMINAHDFVTSAPTTYQWTISDMEQLVGYVAALRDAGTLEVKSWSRWYADLTGRPCDRR